ncbi:MAG: LLM class flavin-dependent oxidoreductase, partial [Halobacteriaceae archaeon]
DIPERFDRFEEGVEVIDLLLHNNDAVSYDGEYFNLQEAKLLPRPRREDGTRLLIGGNGQNRTLPLAAEYATEWNGVFLPPEEYHDLNIRLDEFIEKQGRQPSEVRRSLMTRIVYGRDSDELENHLDGNDPDDLREQGYIVGTAEDIREHLDRLDEVGVDRVMLQWLALDDMDRLKALADAIL